MNYPLRDHEGSHHPHAMPPGDFMLKAAHIIQRCIASAEDKCDVMLPSEIVSQPRGCSKV